MQNRTAASPFETKTVDVIRLSDARVQHVDRGGQRIGTLVSGDGTVYLAIPAHADPDFPPAMVVDEQTALAYLQTAAIYEGWFE